MENKKSVFETLNEINVALEKKEKEANGGKKLSYLPWSKAWEVLKQQYPNASFEVERFDGKPWLYDENLGYMIYTSVTVNGETHRMFLPTMDSNNHAMKAHSYTYKTSKGEKTVEAATMRDISDTTMRCLVKNIALFGLGLNFYYGEDISKAANEEIQKEQREQFVSNWVKAIENAKSLQELGEMTRQLQTWISEENIKTALMKRKEELKNGKV